MSYALVVLPALIGVALGANAYFAPIENTGVDGTPGALLALLGAAAVALGALLAMTPALRGRGLTAMNILLMAGALLTAAAAYFLMQYPFAAAMGLTVVALLVVPFLRPHRRAG